MTTLNISIKVFLIIRVYEGKIQGKAFSKAELRASRSKPKCEISGEMYAYFTRDFKNLLASLYSSLVSKSVLLEHFVPSHYLKFGDVCEFHSLSLRFLPSLIVLALDRHRQCGTSNRSACLNPMPSEASINLCLGFLPFLRGGWVRPSGRQGSGRLARSVFLLLTKRGNRRRGLGNR